MEQQPRLYDELASWWPLLSPPDEYEDDAAFYLGTMRAACDFEPRTLLELGSGGGNNAFHLKRHLRLTLVDLSPRMLEISHALNPECEHVQGDMRTVRLGRQFDLVFIHDAIDYMRSLEDLTRAMETAFIHCRPGGCALFAPDHVRENFRPSTTTGGSDKGPRGLRYLEWTWDPDESDSTYTVDYAYLLRHGDGSVRVEHDRHVGGLFFRADWLRLLKKVGFRPESVPFYHPDVPPGELEVFVAKRLQ